MTEKNTTQNKKALLMAIIISVIILSLASTYLYLSLISGRIYTDKAIVSAPTINLAPQGSGLLEEILVNVGDSVPANTIVARVGNELIKTKVAGVITATQSDTGKLFNRSETVVSMFDPNELRVIGRIDEDKGLSDVRIGQEVEFTVDAYSSKKYTGIVDEISPASREGDVVFNISDKREVKQFDVKVRFDINKYQELKNGMSAKMSIKK
jgi:multidrug resistance efflux pump